MAALAGCQPQPASTASVVRIEGPTMGSTYHISYVPGPGGQPAAAQAQGAVQALLAAARQTRPQACSRRRQLLVRAARSLLA